jgi:hypothetical protein
VDVRKDIKQYKDIIDIKIHHVKVVLIQSKMEDLEM